MLDFPRLAAKYHIPILKGGHHHCKVGWIQTHCPFCAGARGGWHLGWAIESGAWNCWRCGKLDYWTVLQALLKCGRREARERTTEFYNSTAQRVERGPVVRQRTIKPPGGAAEMLPRHRKYLRSRGFDPDELASVYGALGTNHLGGIWAWRVVLPVKNADGRIVAYQGRTIGDAQPRYKMMDDADCLEDPDTFLFGIDRAKGDSVVVVEGALKAVRMGVGAVGTLGIDWKMPQMNLLRRYKRRFILFDPEEKAQQRAEQLGAALSLFPGETELLSGFTVAPDEFSDSQVREIRAELGL